jgi:Fe-coproporphyrin III synthase
MRKVKLATEVAKRYLKPGIAKVNIATTFRCNQRCITCNIWKDGDKYTSELEIKVHDVERLIDNNKIMWISFTGGEPFLNHSISDIMAMASHDVKMMSITTNGQLSEWIRESIAYVLGHNGESDLLVNVSLNGDRDTHDKIAGVTGSFGKAIKTIENLKKIKSKRLLVSIEHTLSRFNADQYKNIEIIADTYGVDVVYNAEQNSTYYNNMKEHINGNIKVPDRYNIFRDPNINGLMNMMFLEGVKRGKRSGCVAGRFSCFIDPYMNVYPCIFNVPNVRIKNLRDGGYKLDGVHKSILMKVVKECKGCWTPCETYTTMMFRPWKVL